VRNLLRPGGGEHYPSARVVAHEARDCSYDKGEDEPEKGSDRIPYPGVPDHVPEDGDEREEDGDQEQAIALVRGYPITEGSLVGALAHLSRS
jgi:hypothetical protein